LFRFGIAVQPGDVAALQIESSADELAVALSLASMRILVVDDNAVNQQVVGGLLTRAGHRVVTVDSGPAAIAEINGAASDRFDVVLMDVQMPGMDGLTATGRIRALPPPQNLVPVIALTARASNSSRAECLGAGMNGFVSKPVRLRPLLDEIAQVLGSAEKVATETLLDIGQVDELTTSLSPDAWHRIIASFTDSADAEIERIIDAIKSGRSPARATHTLKGVAWNTGAFLLGNLAKQLETAPPAEAQRLAAELRPVLQLTTTALLATSHLPAEA
jgi:CheY-like chemotaxis protein/HPt (histidine-containing phosphotransfer) domain-containing protein